MASGLCPVNGICVGPYENSKLGDEICCPPCIYFSPEDGGCAGQFACNENVVCQKEKKVEYPGNVIKCDSYNISPKCPDRDTYTTEQLKEDCWSPSHPLENKRIPYVYLSKDDFNNNCEIYTLNAPLIDDPKIKENEYNNINEYECALTCQEDNLSPRDCSKRCLPKLWRWYPVITTNTEFHGYLQSNDTIRELSPEEAPSMKYCPENKCIYDRNIGDFTTLNRCSGCEGCRNITSALNPSFKAYVCDKCDQCLLDIPGDDQPTTIACTNLNNCSSCTEYKTLDTPLVSDTEDLCNKCNIPDDPSQGGCTFYTRIAYERTEDEFGTDMLSLREGVKEYNIGGGYDNKCN